MVSGKTVVVALLVGSVIGAVVATTRIHFRETPMRRQCQALGGQWSHAIRWIDGGPALNSVCAFRGDRARPGG